MQTSEEEMRSARWEAAVEMECKLVGVARRKGKWERWGWGGKRRELCTLLAGCAPRAGEGVVFACGGGGVAGKRNVCGEDERLQPRGCGGAAVTGIQGGGSSFRAGIVNWGPLDVRGTHFDA